MQSERPIEIKISNSSIVRCAGEMEARLHIFGRCVDAGIPVQMSPTTGEIRVTRGMLTTTELFEMDSLSVRWDPWEPPQPPAEPRPSVWSRIKHVAKVIWNA